MGGRMSVARKASGWLVVLAVLCLGWWGWCALTEIGNLREKPAPAKKAAKSQTAPSNMEAAESEPDTPILNLRSSRIRENSEFGHHDVSRILTNSATEAQVQGAQPRLMSPPLLARRAQSSKRTVENPTDTAG